MTALPLPSGGGVEVSGGSYARVAYTNDTANYPAPSGGVVQNANPIDWGTASANWEQLSELPFTTLRAVVTSWRSHR